jgi:hypothetical protein
MPELLFVYQHAVFAPRLLVLVQSDGTLVLLVITNVFIALSIVAKRSSCLFLKFTIPARGAVGITIAIREHAWGGWQSKGACK